MGGAVIEPATSFGNDWRLKPASSIGVDVVIPVLNEAHVLERSVQTVHDFLARNVPYRWRIVIAENGSTDGTAEVATRLCERFERVELLVIGKRGRGRALRAAWVRGDADILCYTDVDLSTELEAFPRLFAAIIDGGYDLAVGSRLARGARTTRSLKRDLISRTYNLILKLALDVRFSDAQTGFKAITREVARDVMPLVEDDGWFLDTELLVLSEKMGYRIADIPVQWIEDDDSRVKIIRTAWEDLKGVNRLRRVARAGALRTAASVHGRAARLTPAQTDSSLLPLVESGADVAAPKS
jgi:glycosyltransferase involved in cell wall biosynthesis